MCGEWLLVYTGSRGVEEVTEAELCGGWRERFLLLLRSSGIAARGWVRHLVAADFSCLF